MLRWNSEIKIKAEGLISEYPEILVYMYQTLTRQPNVLFAVHYVIAEAYIGNIG